jgi:ABC-2 type transport system ATP-binding protein
MIVEVKNLVKRFDQFIAVDNVTFSIKEGEIFGLLGPNGAGKTTTISSITGMSNIDSGEIKIFGMSMKNQEREIKKKVGIVPQDLAIFEDLTTYENLLYFGKLYGLRGGELKDSADKAMEFVGLLDRKKDYPKKFSGGMKRRLNIAIGIVHNPKLVIMDEPTVGIDPQSRNYIIDSIKKLNERGTTIIYTSHYMEEVEELCNRMVIMDNGKIIANGNKEELKEMVSLEEKIDLEVSGINYTIMDKLKSLNGVTDCSMKGNKITIVSKKYSKITQKIINIISDSESEIISLNVEKPTLETVFLTLTGKKLRD